MPIESSILPPAATDYLNQIADTPKTDPMIQFNVEAAKQELLDFCNDFIEKSKAWRTASYEEKWHKYQRNSDGIYDPAIAQAKEDWQSKVHVGITAAHRESIHAYLFKVMAGTNPSMDIAPRFDLGEVDQSNNIKAVIMRELDKARWETEFDSCLHYADTLGSGFLRRYWVTETAIRKLKKPVLESFKDNLNPMGMVGFIKRAAMGQLKTVGFQSNEEEVITYRGLKIQNVSPWDVFKTPKTIKIPGNTIAWKYYITYGELVKGVEKGYFLPDALDKLKGIKTEKKFSQGESLVNSDRGVTDSNANTPEYGTELECYELYGKLPEKWIYTVIGQQITGNPEKLVSARIIFHKSCPIAVEVNDEYDGEPPIHQLNYFPKAGDSYGMGIPEMLESPQAVINEIVNQRLDNGAQVLNTTYGVIEKALVNAKEDLKSKPGRMVRFDARYVPNADVRNVMTQFQVNDTPTKAGFAEVTEWERFAQDRTSSNRVMQGSGSGGTGTKTLGEQQMLMESAGVKFSYIGLMMELSFSQDFFHGIWKTVYKNIDPEDIVDSIGPEKAKTFILLTPEEIMRDYIYKPLGVFSMENRALRQGRLIQIRDKFIGAPWIDDEKFFDAICRTADEDAEEFKKPDAQIMMDQAGMIQPGMGDGQDTTGNPGTMPPVDTTGPEEIKQAYKSGSISREMAVSLLKEHHGFN